MRRRRTSMRMKKILLCEMDLQSVSFLLMCPTPCLQRIFAFCVMIRHSVIGEGGYLTGRRRRTSMRMKKFFMCEMIY